MLATHVAAWMRKRGKSLRPKLSEEQKKQLEECYELMDADGSGAIDADELGAAFKLLGLDVTKSEIGAMLDEVDEDGSGEVEYPEFIEIMTHTLSKLAHKKEEDGQAGNQVPFALLATAYRRKRIMEGLISGDREVMAQVTTIAEHASRRAAEDAAQQAAALQQQQRHTSAHQARERKHPGSNLPSNLPSYASTPKGSSPGAGARSSIFRSPVSSNTGSIEGQQDPRLTCSTSGLNSSSGSGNHHAAAVAAAMAAAAGEARASQVAAQAGMPSGLLRALQHVKSFCSIKSSHSNSGLAGSSAGSSQRNSLDLAGRPLVAAASSSSAAPLAGPGGVAAGGGGVLLSMPWGGSSSSVLADDMFFDWPEEAVAGVLDVEEQRQLICILRAKTRKRLEAVAAAAAAAGQPGAASLNPSRWPTASGATVAAAGSNSSGGCGGCGGSCDCSQSGPALSAGGGAGRAGSSSRGGSSSGGSGAVSAVGACAGGCGSAGVGSSSSTAASSGLEGLVGSNQRMTSKLMLEQLTKEFQPPKFALGSPSQRSAAASGSTNPTFIGVSPAGRSSNSRSAGRSRSSTPSPVKQQQLSPGGVCGSGAAAADRSSSPPLAAATPASAMAGGPHAGRLLTEAVCGPGTTNSWPTAAPAAAVCAVGLSVTPSSQKQQ